MKVSTDKATQNKNNDNETTTDQSTMWQNWLNNYTDLLKKTHQIMKKLPGTTYQAKPEESLQNFSNIAKRYAEYWEHLAKDPMKVFQAHITFTEQIMKVWQQLGFALLGHKHEHTSIPTRTDKRFKSDDWETNPLFSAIKKAYFVTADYLQSLTSDVKGLDPKTAAQVQFYTQQFVDALAPTNFVLTNPDILKKTIDTQGANLLKGFNNMLDDLRKNAGRFHIKMTDMEAFKVGENVAITPGKVMYENEMMQLIQYEPTTKKVGATPLLIVPPWINKYYILDLRPDNSFVKFALDQGNTVFIISWVNPHGQHAERGFDDYLLAGPIAALEVIEKITGEKEVNAAAFCLGGTLLGCTAAYLTAKKQQAKIKSLTFLATLLDFSIPGDLGVFIDEEQVKSIEAQMAKVGYLHGHDMRMAFNLLRSNDLIWSYFVNNYLAGETPFPFDLLYWNCDSTNLPAKMHSFYLREMYGHNRLAQPDGISLDNTPIDLRKIAIPAYFISTEYDHIAPWDGTYKGATLFSSDVRFVLGGSGHIAGIVNPPVKQKYGFRTNTQLPKEAQEWYENSVENSGSWWNDWQKWITPFMGDMIPARKPGDSGIKPIEEAPGRYVQVNLE